MKIDTTRLKQDLLILCNKNKILLHNINIEIKQNETSVENISIILNGYTGIDLNEKTN